VYGTAGSGGVGVFDVSEPTLPFKVAEYSHCFGVYNVTISDSLAICRTNQGVGIFNITDPLDCVEISYFQTRADVDMDVQGNYVHLTDPAGGMRILDITDPVNMFEASHYYLPGLPMVIKIFVQGDFAYLIGSGNYEFGIVNVANPANPYVVGGIPYNDTFSLYDVHVVEDYAYCGSADGLKIIDVSNPYNPHLAAKCSLAANYCEPIFVANDHAFLGGGGYLWIVDVSDPLNPHEVSQVPYSFIGDIFVVGPYAYIAGPGLRILDVSDPTNPQEIGYYTTPYTAGYYVHCDNDYIYLACGYDGLWIFDFYGYGVADKGLSPSPSKNLKVNSIGNAIKFSYSLRKNSTVKILLLDVCGRVIRQISSNECAGIHADEFTNYGISAGVYFLHVETSDWCETRKVVLLK
jgi:hypothetical protein